MKPYHVLSNGEKMRCDLARAIASKKKLIVFDEFTSVVDRQVAKAASFALAKHLRRKRAKRFIAVTCHYDVLDWLQPDWTLDMATQELARGCLRRRPPITFQVARVHHSAWELFRKHHYLNHGMSQAARCFVAFWDEHPVSFCAVLDLFHKQKKWLVTRWVTLPDYQGLGIGLELLERTAAWMGTYKPFSIRSSHPAVISTLHRSPHWAMRQVVKPIGTSEKRPDFRVSRAGLRVTASFEYVGPLGDRREARRVMDAKPKPFLLPEDTRRALEVVRQTPGVTVPVIAGRLGVSRDRVRSGLESLRRSGEVIRKGVGRGPSPFAYYPEEFAS
jgi:GNAT superfamily N-acetyltransferase